MSEIREYQESAMETFDSIPESKNVTYELIDGEIVSQSRPNVIVWQTQA